MTSENNMINFSFKSIAHDGRNIKLEKFVPVEVDESIGWLDHFKLKGWTSVKLEGWNDEFVKEFTELINTGVVGFDLKYPNSGLIKYNFGQTELQWKIRELVYPYYIKLENTDDLLVSFDGGCYMKPNIENSESKTFKDWIHHDYPNFEFNHILTQGLVNFIENGPEDGGLVLMDTRDIFEQYIKDNSNRFIDINHPLLSSKILYKICAKAGYLILWDVRCFHMNIPPVANRQRMCIYVLFRPRYTFSSIELDKRIQLYEQGKQDWEEIDPFYYLDKNKDKNNKYITDINFINSLRYKLIGYSKKYN